MLSLHNADQCLAKHFDSNFKNINVLKNFDRNIWSEGGEWPILDNIKHFESAPAVAFAWPTECVQLRDVVQAQRHVDTALLGSKVIGLSMPCGAGKSTHLMLSLLRKSIYTTVINVQPSILSAVELVKYLHAQTRDSIVTRSYDPAVKSLVYMSAGEFLAMLHTRVDISNALIVIDEYHSINPVYKALEKVLSYCKAHILCITASSTSNLRSRKNVVVQGHEEFDSTMTDLVSKNSIDSSTTLVVGCCPGLSLNKAANHIVGLTLHVDHVIDFATRLDPTYDDNALLLTYRKATVPEITQMLGRLARTPSVNGKFDYIENPGQFSYQGKPKLYSKVYDALISAFGLGIESNYKSIRQTLSCEYSPVISKPQSIRSSVNAHSNVPSSIQSKSTTRNSSSTSYSSLRSPRPDETQRVTKTSSGYSVDYVPKDPIKRLFSTRASTWSANPPDCQVTSFDRQNTLLHHMNSEVSLQPEVVSPPQVALPLTPPLSNEDMSMATDLVTGKAFPTYQPEELSLIQRAWHSYLAANPNRFARSVTIMEQNIRMYFAAYKRMRDLYRMN